MFILRARDRPKQTANGAAHGAPRRADPTLANLRLFWPGTRVSPTLVEVSLLETPRSGPTNLRWTHWSRPGPPILGVN